MIAKTKRKLKRVTKRWLKNKNFVLLLVIIIFCLGIILYTTYMQNKRLTVDPSTYDKLLTLVGKAESKNNYNAYFGNPSNQSVKFTDMTIAEVLRWQSEHVSQGNVSSAVGKYQIINTTLSELVDKTGMDKGQKFDQATQDKLAISLIEKRGSEEYINKELTREELAANLAKEWAALPKVVGDNPNESYYAADGINKSLVKVEEVLNAIEQIKPE